MTTIVAINVVIAFVSRPSIDLDEQTTAEISEIRVVALNEATLASPYFDRRLGSQINPNST